MITIEEGLTAFLSANAGLTTLIGGRVYLMRIPQGATLPCLTYQRISTPRVLTHDTSGSAGTAHPRFQFDAWGTTYTAVKGIADAARAALNGYTGTMGSSNPVTVQAALIDDESPEFAPDVKLWRVRMDFIIWHLEG
jgi:hypothetical protein